ncbi:MAG: tRNA preQ1(34) S-adenosylmethionine ribosyltransferase-isomerase QueA [Deltaproteobacteria bacterium CG17_big_fil_post_rev_8_21_14_2_50_63_7]|nr:MAG: tRNA preQ1(34) S-adenosylmethionine ribosyltransferase-isomerase QueA [Deltaproteobacteria bacterium CG17_big_fil_post_rev_8_21_14_2_50_63_7]
MSKDRHGCSPLASTDGDRRAELERTDAYDFLLPEELIAAEPAAERTASRLLLVGDSGITHSHFWALGEALRAGDLLVVNDVSVCKARLYARKESGGRVELLVISRPAREEGGWGVECMVRTRRGLEPGVRLQLERLSAGTLSDQWLRVTKRNESGTWNLSFESEGEFAELLSDLGQLPLPPYIVKRRREMGMEEYGARDELRYQTIFADGGAAVAAPTAGLHFSPELIASLRDNGVEVASLKLEVGPGTFRPVQVERLDEHEMHFEDYSIGPALVEAYERCRARGGRVVAVGTTVVRSLEDQVKRFGALRAGQYSTDIFLRPGHRFGSIDGMVTNFHLPKSTLLVLVSAFGGYARMQEAYALAIAQRYRFYSYGDAMLIWKSAL